MNENYNCREEEIIIKGCNDLGGYANFRFCSIFFSGAGE